MQRTVEPRLGISLMDFHASIEGLLNDGRIRLGGVELPDDEARQAAGATLAEFERQYRIDCPGSVPELSLRAAVWAAEMFHGAVMGLVYREIDEAGIAEILSQPFPGPRDAKAHYSVDLTFRLLPGLHARAKSASQSDPLLGHIEQWAKEWPLSSVGISGVEPEQLEVILEHDSLRMMYIDRIIATKDRSRLNHPEVRASIEAACGIHNQLAPEIQSALAETKSKVDS